MHGRDSLISVYAMFIKSMPDMCLELHSSTIRVYSNNTSTVICRYTFSGTKVFSIEGLEKNGNQRVVVSTSNKNDELSSKLGKLQLNAKVSSMGDDDLIDGSSAGVEADVKVTMGEVNKARPKYAIIGTISFHCNSDKKVFCIDYSMSNYDDYHRPLPLE